LQKLVNLGFYNAKKKNEVPFVVVVVVGLLLLLARKQ
jgi:hypothetical protein